MLDWFTAMLIGIIQGITEWLPVSSSGQTTIVMVNFLGIPVESAITLGLAVHIGTALAVMIKYPLQLSKLRKITATSKFYWATTFISLLDIRKRGLDRADHYPFHRFGLDSYRSSAPKWKGTGETTCF